MTEYIKTFKNCCRCSKFNTIRILTFLDDIVFSINYPSDFFNYFSINILELLGKTTRTRPFQQQQKYDLLMI